MKHQRKHMVLWMLLCSGLSEAIEPISISIALGTAAALTGFLIGRYPNFFDSSECCQPEWISFNKTGLEVDLERKLFGQHLASQIVLKAVKSFMNNNNPQKPLVLSLHGSTGTGKNFVSKIIAGNLYKKGMDSSFVHLFTSEHHFPHASQIETYKSQLRQWIIGNVTNCERSMFIFDEMDQMHPGLIDSIKPYLEYYDKLDGVSYRKAIFIFLSNAGGESINQIALDFWNGGRNREEIRLSDVEAQLSLSVFNINSSGLRRTDLIYKGLVDYFVPFLPLEYKHVVQCALAEMKARGLKPDESIAKKVADDLIYFPKTERVFSSKGCKAVVSKLSNSLEDAN